MFVRHTLLGAAFALCLVVPAIRSSAQTTPPPPKELSPIAQAQKLVQESQTQLNKEKAAAAAARAKIEQRFRSRPDWAAAEVAVTKTKVDHEAAIRTAVETRQAQPDYKAAAAGKLAAEEKQRALQEAGRASPEQLAAAGDELIKHATAVRRMESEAMQDPKIAEAKLKRDAAEKQMATLRQEVEAIAKTDKDCLAADAKVVAAQATLTSAQTSLKTTMKSEQDARAAAAKSRRPTK